MAHISLNEVSVGFPIYDGVSRSLKNRIVTASTGGRISAIAGQPTVVTALDRVSFTIEHGDRVGLIGHNGAGKTTLLRVLAGIYIPARGRVRRVGQVAPLFDTGFGMDPDATGYENIRLRGMYLGLTKKQIADRIEEIAEFAELGSFLTMPLRTYSAGMQTRLAFAVSTSIDPEILLLDEQIGAGDAAFMEKASVRLEQLVERSGILVLASHSNDAIRRFCTKALVLEHGRVVHFGDIEEALDRYAAPKDR
ncbi:MAG TPA: ABC transporter ATP-binding protein [Microvirga sp.]|jgi:ABC-2 type transport system ATP-binding protein/lipopolysaccharide transport system ATP-binding protein